MKDAGIKVWVLTGDKVETAINIGCSSGLIDPDMNLFEMTFSNYEDNNMVLDKLDEFYLNQNWKMLNNNITFSEIKTNQNSMMKDSPE